MNIRPALRIARNTPLAAAAGAGFFLGIWLAGTALDGSGAGAAAGLIGAPTSWPAVSGMTAIGAIAAAAGIALLSWGLHRAHRKPKPAADPLTETAWQLDFAMRAAGLGFWELDLDTRALRCDARACVLLGLPDRRMHEEADWLGRIVPEDRTRAFDEAHRALDLRGTVTLEYRVAHPDGRIRKIEDFATACRGANGERRIVGLVRDITDRHDTAEELRWHRRRAEDTAREKARFLAVMSHEIRTPMTSILGMLDLVIDEPDSRSRIERLAIARSSARALLAILNDVLAFSRLEAGRFEINAEPFRPRRLVADVMELMTPGAEAKGIDLRWTLAPDVPEWVLADPGRIRQVLVNIVGNAVKFTGSGEVAANVTLVPGVTEAGAALGFEVRDSGVGMRPELLRRAFDSFVRDESPDARREEGTGLGLAISQHLVRLMGGSIDMESTPGEGSVARFVIPIEPARALPPELSEPELATPEVAGPESSGFAGPADVAIAPMRILVAEDNATNQYLVRALLEREGHRVTTVRDGAEAVEAARAGDFDVILMDAQMPVMDGASATRAIRASGRPCADTPIIALTANALATDRQVYLAAGMSDYVTKPIELAALNSALARAARSRRAVSAEDVVTG